MVWQEADEFSPEKNGLESRRGKVNGFNRLVPVLMFSED